ncbi:MAG: ABC transporter substrate-binding protein [Thermoplasmatales archaeon]|nr:ABC transporter substrate-binding protein [Thermoplasmatales archaeon]
MASKKVIAVIVVAAIVAASAAVAIIALNEESVDSRIPTGRLQIYGNAFNDDVIDNYDVEILEKIISDGNWDEVKETYPYADANRDGSITQEDVDIVEKIINREECKIFYVDGNDDVKSVNFPVDHFLIAGSMVHPVIGALDVANNAVGRAGKSSSLDDKLCAPTIGLTQIGSRPWNIDMSLVSTLETQPTAVITLYSSSYDAVVTAVDGALDCIRVNTEAGDKTLNAYLLLGVLLGAQERANEIVEFYDKYSNDIKGKLKTISDEKRITTISLYSYSMCGTEYYLTKNTEAAGGVNLSDFSDSNTKTCKDAEWHLNNKYQAEYLFEYTSWGFTALSTKNELAEAYDYYGQWFTKMDGYKNGKYVCINKDLPDIIRITYVASILYPELFGTDYGDKANQEFIDKFFGYLNENAPDKKYDVTSDGTWVITYKMAHGTDKPPV